MKTKKEEKIFMMKEEDLSILLRYLIKEKQYVPFDVIEKETGNIIHDVFLGKNAKVVFTISKLTPLPAGFDIRAADKIFKVKDYNSVVELSVPLKKIKKQRYMSVLTLRGFPIISMSSNIRITQKKKGVHEFYFVNAS